MDIFKSIVGFIGLLGLTIVSSLLGAITFTLLARLFLFVMGGSFWGGHFVAYPTIGAITGGCLFLAASIKTSGDE